MQNYSGINVPCSYCLLHFLPYGIEHADFSPLLFIDKHDKIVPALFRGNAVQFSGSVLKPRPEMGEHVLVFSLGESIAGGIPFHFVRAR